MASNTAVEAAKTNIEEHGYCVLEDLLETAEADRFDSVGRALMSGPSEYAKLEGALAEVPDLAPLCIDPPEEWPLVPQNLYAQFPPRLQQLLERSVERAIDNTTSG